MRMREEHDQQIRVLSNQFSESSRRNLTNQAGNNSEVDERLNAENPPFDQNIGGGPIEDNNTGGGPTEDNNTGSGPVIPLRNRPRSDTDEDEKIMDLGSKINTLMSAQGIKRTSILSPYPRKWDSIPYPEAYFLVLCCLAYYFGGGLSQIANVIDYGAVGDGKRDDTQAFSTAWDVACNASDSTTMLIPSGKTFMIYPVVFKGPCKSPVHVQVDGNIVAPSQIWKRPDSDHWITFLGVKEGIRINGSGQFDGNGNIWWTCREKNICSDAPDTLAFGNCSNITLEGLRFVNSPMKHISIFKSSGVQLRNLTILAPGESPNTDGIHIEESQQAEISNSIIGTGDDCISIGSGTSNLNITQINCGPGHGISIGSLGRGGTKATVNQVLISNCKFNKTTNGLRIKTWPGGSGLVNDIKFVGNNFTEVYNPIIINQFYCDHSKNCGTGGSAVKIQDVHYIGASGTSASTNAITLNCSASAPCTGLIMDDVSLQYVADPPATAFCINAQGTEKSPVKPKVPCLN
ncbi:polygalacturonase ADPG2-like [Asparagus officinalis]|uniref:polygalacturonase ADPG2-like n=1 Tax=Asparagus officinalis TaxID=4686 RepID=UPI00098E75CA|nr:polygalacturonase ADPG2-like [Asparagus officinalis]